MTKYCPACGEELIDAAKFCKNCGAEIDNPQKTTNTYQENRRQYIELSDKNYTIAIVVGYVMAILIPLIGLIIGIYLLTRDSSRVKKHGKFVLIVTVVVWTLSVISVFR